MARKLDNILNDLENSLANLKQVTLTGPDYTPVDAICKRWLKERGYSVQSPFKHASNPRGYDDLFNYFYELFKKYYPDLIVPYNGDNHDRKIAKEFVAMRMEATGASLEASLHQCAEIIEAMFRYKDRLKFDKAPGFGIFTPSMGWLVGKIIDYMNMDKAIEAEKRVDAKIEAQTKLIEKDLPVDDLEEIFRRNNV